MTPALVDRPALLFEAAAGREERGHREPLKRGRGVTLEEVLTAALGTARADGSAQCPVCFAHMSYTRAGAECGGCRSRLS